MLGQGQSLHRNALNKHPSHLRHVVSKCFMYLEAKECYYMSGTDFTRKLSKQASHLRHFVSNCFVYLEGYDSGDCCQCTCVSTPDYTCGDRGFQCIDPSASCVEDDDDAAVSCITIYFGDGDCDARNNNEDCGKSTRSVPRLQFKHIIITACSKIVQFSTKLTASNSAYIAITPHRLGLLSDVIETIESSRVRDL